MRFHYRIVSEFGEEPIDLYVDMPRQQERNANEHVRGHVKLTPTETLWSVGMSGRNLEIIKVGREQLSL